MLFRSDQAISPELERLMEGRQIYQHKAGEAHLPLCAAPGRFSLDTEDLLPNLLQILYNFYQKAQSKHLWNPVIPAIMFEGNV